MRATNLIKATALFTAGFVAGRIAAHTPAVAEDYTPVLLKDGMVSVWNEDGEIVNVWTEGDRVHVEFPNSNVEISENLDFEIRDRITTTTLKVRNDYSTVDLMTRDVDFGWDHEPSWLTDLSEFAWDEDEDTFIPLDGFEDDPVYTDEYFAEAAE